MKTKTVKPTKAEKDKLVFQVRPSMDIAEELKIEIISDKKVNFSEAKAFEYLELETFQGERQVNERHVQFLYNAWVAGRFMWDHVILALCECEGKRYRINGQHCCWMRANLPKDHFINKGEEPRVREVIYRASDQGQMRTLYSTFDQNKTRSASHVFRALLSGTKQSEDLWPSVLNTLSAGLKLWLFEWKDRWMVNPNDIAQLVEDKHSELFRIVGLYIQSHYQDSQWLRRAGVVAALFATFDKAGGKAPEFWDAVVTGLGLNDKTDPRYMLRDYVTTHGQSSTSSGVRRGRGAVFTTAEDTYRVCLLAWNKWRGGEKQRAGLRATDKRFKAQ